MNKKLLLTVLAAGLVFPTAVANANQPLTQEAKPALDPAKLFPGTGVDGRTVNVDPKGAVTAKGSSATAGEDTPQVLPTNNNANQGKGASVTVDGKPEVFPARSNINAGTGAGVTASKPEVDPSVLDHKNVKVDPITGAVTATGTGVTAVKPAAKLPSAKPAVKAAVAKAKASTKTGAKKLPKTSAVK